MTPNVSATLPLVSIIVPVFNGEKYLGESLESLLNQTYPRIEILVMDDSSTDNTEALVSAYGNRLRYYRQPSNRGIYGNVNDGIEMARGDYIAVYHADDIYDSHIVEREAAFLECYPECGAVFCLDIFIDALGREYNRLKIPSEVRGGRPLKFPVVFNGILKYKNRFLVCPSAMVRAAVYRDVGLYRDQEFRIASDLEMWLRIAQKYPVGILEEYLLKYRHGHGNATQEYYHLRTEPERHFTIIDAYLQNGGRAIATADALAAYEAHRAEDRLMIAINHYIRSELSQAKSIIGLIEVRQLLGSDEVQYVRLLILLLLLKSLLCIPRISFVADQFYRHWYSKKYSELS